MINYHITSATYEIKVDGRFERGWTKRYDIYTADLETFKVEKMIKHNATKVHLTYETIPE